jgi:hypothetical protein
MTVAIGRECRAGYRRGNSGQCYAKKLHQTSSNIRWFARRANLFVDPEHRISGLPVRLRRGGIAAPLASDHAQEPEHQDQDQYSAKTDIHDTLLCSCF